MIYRQAHKTDGEALASVQKSQPRCAQWEMAGWQGELDAPGARIWCAQEQAHVVGFVALRFVAGVGEITNVAVLPQWCGRGIGSRLLEQTLEWVRQQGGGKITLEVGVNNTSACKLYEKAGFVALGLRKHFYQTGEDALIMGIEI